MKIPAYLLLILLIILCFHGCVDHDIRAAAVVECNSAEILSYLEDVVPVIDANCAVSGCHGDNPGIPNWEEYTELQRHQSEIQRRITLPVTDPSHMPQGGVLSPRELQTLFCWIEQGAQQN